MTTESIFQSLPHAGFWRRVGASLIDGLLMIIVMVLLGVLFYLVFIILINTFEASQTSFENTANALLKIYLMMTLAVPLVYGFAFEAIDGSTIGKKQLSVQVFDVHSVGRAGCGFKKSFLRQICKNAPILLAIPFQLTEEFWSQIFAVQVVAFIATVVAPLFWGVWVVVSVVNRRDAIYDRLAGTTVRRVDGK